MEITILYRPVGQIEYDLIEASDFRKFPPRLPSQPFFYPVTNADYATQIARDWNTKDEASGYAGYVLRFHVGSEFLAKYASRTVGTSVHQEYWIPADELAEFNDHILGRIEVIDSFRAPGYSQGIETEDRMPMVTVYQLRRDVQQIASIQRATTHTEDFGIEPTHGLFGSEEWWGKIESGELPKLTVCGVITRVYMGSMRDWPEFSMTADNGEALAWTRYVNTRDQDRFYRIGSRVELDFVIQHRRKKSRLFPGDETKCVLEVRVSDARSRMAS